MTQPQDAADPFAVFETGEGAWPPVHESGDLLHQYRGARLDSGASIISESGADDNQSAALATQPNNDLATALRRLSLDTSVSVTNNSSLATFGSTFGQPRRLSHLPPEDAQHFAAMQYVPPPQLSGLPDNAALMIPVVGGLLVPPGESPGHTPSPDFNNNATPSPKTLNGPPPIKSRNVYIAALPIGFTDQHLAEMLGQFGKITSARMFNDTRRVEAVGRSYGFVLFERAEDAEAAVQGLSGLVIDGRRIQIRLSLNGVVRAPRTKPPEYGAAMSPSNHSSPRLTSGSHPATPSSSQHSFAVSPGTAHAGSPSTVTVPMPAYGARTSPQLVGQTPIFALPQPRTPTLSGSPQSSASGGAVLQQQQQMPGMMPYAGYVAPAPYYGLVSPSPGGFDPVTGQPLAAATAPYAPSSPPPGAYYHQQHQHHHQQHHQPHHQQQHHSASPSVLPPPR